MRPRSCIRALGPLLLAGAAAEAAGRLLSPRGTPIEPDVLAVGDYFTAAEIDRGARYARPQLAIGLAGSAVGAGALGLYVRGSARASGNAFAGAPSAVRRPPGSAMAALGAGAATAAGLSLAGTILSLPISAAARRRSLQVGLATQSWRDWGVDMVKATAIQTAFAAVGGGAVVGVTRRYPRGWWAPAAAGSVVFGAGLAALAPVLLDPVFNDFTPLPIGETRSDVLALAEAAGVKVGEVYSVDASRRTTAANAYVTGLGPSKRVVLFDTLLERYDRDEVRVVVAHELAHVRHRDVPRGVAFAALVAGPTALAIQRLSWVLAPRQRGTAAALPALALATGIVSAPIGLISSRLSRAIERRADTFSLELSRAAEAFVSFERKIAVQNVADLDPPRWLTGLIASHPPTLERIGAAVAFARGAGATPAPEGPLRTPAGS
ncbi:MAG: M48 family metalloprotease [Actinomycetota bacterium]|nr:M48 family metalloprotease [Actinomycetota bacterium]